MQLGSALYRSARIDGGSSLLDFTVFQECTLFLGNQLLEIIQYNLYNLSTPRDNRKFQETMLYKLYTNIQELGAIILGSLRASRNACHFESGFWSRRR